MSPGLHLAGWSRLFPSGFVSAPVAFVGDADGVLFAVGSDGHVDVMRVAVSCKVGDEFVRRVIFDIVAEVFVELIHRLDPGALDGGKGRRAAALCHAVVHPRDGWR